MKQGGQRGAKEGAAKEGAKEGSQGLTLTSVAQDAAAYIHAQYRMHTPVAQDAGSHLLSVRLRVLCITHLHLPSPRMPLR